MKPNGVHTYSEITTQPQAWATALASYQPQRTTIGAAWSQLDVQQVIFTGCGSTYYLAQIAAALWQSTVRQPATAYPASELVLTPEGTMLDPARTLLVTISRSGTTTETLAAVARFRQLGGKPMWTITCDPASPLAQQADLVLDASAGQEESVAQTRSFATMLLLAQALAATVGGQAVALLDQLPALGEQLLVACAPTVQRLAADETLTRVYFLGAGLQHGVAHEAMLKMTEMALTPSAAFHFLEFRHGPKSMATADALVVGLISPRAGHHERPVLQELAALGATTLWLTPQGAPVTAAPAIVLPADLPAWAMPVLYLPPLQLLAYHRAMVKGLDPDNPRNLTTVVYLDAATLLAA